MNFVALQNEEQNSAHLNLMVFFDQVLESYVFGLNLCVGSEEQGLNLHFENIIFFIPSKNP
jgi:hypothetical protein